MKTKISRKRHNGMFCYVFFISLRRDICEIRKFYSVTPSTNKSMAVRNAKCHFVSEQRLSDQFNYKKSILYCFNYCKINSDSMFELSTGQSLCGRTVLTGLCQIACRTLHGQLPNVGQLWCIVMLMHIVGIS